jgi:uncharacterized protein (TIGR02118 family)
MLKTVTLMPRRRDVTRAAFREHYEKNHTPLALGFIAHFPFRKYVRNHLLASAPDDIAGAPVDSLSEFWFADAAASDRARAFLSTPDGETMLEDERRFTDQASIASFRSRELLIAGTPRGFEADRAVRKAAWPLRLDARLGQDTEGARLHAALRTALAGLPGRFTLDLKLPGHTYGRIPFDALLFHWPMGPAPDDMKARLDGIATVLPRLDAEQLETPPEKLAR